MGSMNHTQTKLVGINRQKISPLHSGCGAESWADSAYVGAGRLSCILVKTTAPYSSILEKMVVSGNWKTSKRKISWIKSLFYLTDLPCRLWTRDCSHTSSALENLLHQMAHPPQEAWAQTLWADFPKLSDKEVWHPWTHSPEYQH
jgi:hypothetical protein